MGSHALILVLLKICQNLKCCDQGFRSRYFRHSGDIVLLDCPLSHSDSRYTSRRRERSQSLSTTESGTIIHFPLTIFPDSQASSFRETVNSVGSMIRNGNQHHDEAVFSDIVKSWKASNVLAVAQKSLLDNLSFSSDEFVDLTEKYTLSPGVELHHSKIRLHERPTVVQEVISRKVDCRVSTPYGRSLMHGDSTSILSLS